MKIKKYYPGALFTTLFLLSTAQAEKLTVNVNGMVCSFCAQGIKRSFESLSSVQEVVPNLENKLVVITTKENSDLSDEKIKTIIQDAGYDVVSIKREK